MANAEVALVAVTTNNASVGVSPTTWSSTPEPEHSAVSSVAPHAGEAPVAGTANDSVAGTSSFAYAGFAVVTGTANNPIVLAVSDVDLITINAVSESCEHAAVSKANVVEAVRHDNVISAVETPVRAYARCARVLAVCGNTRQMPVITIYSRLVTVTAVAQAQTIAAVSQPATIVVTEEQLETLTAHSEPVLVSA